MHADTDNRMRWDGEPGHYEVWYLTGNDLPSRTGYWIRYTLEAPLSGDAYAQLWFAFFDRARPERSFALNRKLPIDRLEARPAPFEVRVGEAALASTYARGAIEGAGHAAAWDLAFEPGPRTLRQLPGFLYGLSLADTLVLTPAPAAAMRGRIEADGVTVELAGAPGCQTHLWGRKHAWAWAWGRASAWDGGEDAVVECLSVRLRRRGVVLPPLTLVTLRLAGETIALSGLHHAAAGRASFGAGSYRFRALGPEAIVEGEFSCGREALVEAAYEDPDGDAAWCRNTEIGDLTLAVRRRAGLRFHEAARLRATGTAHFETASRESDPTVPRRHLTVE